MCVGGGGCCNWVFCLFVVVFLFFLHKSSLVCMVGITYVYIDTVFGFGGYFFFNPSLLLSWMFEHDCLDTYCFERLICMCFVFLYLHLFSAIEHVSHGKALWKHVHHDH